MSELSEEEIARAIVGPHRPVHESSQWALHELREVRWKQLTNQEQAEALDQARAVLALLQPALERARREAPEGWMLVPVDPKDEHIGKNYTHGLWSRRNWEAALEDIAAAIRKG